jgi:hypothetical protein
MHSDRAYRTYLGWYQRATRIKLRQCWTDDDYTGDGTSNNEDTVYDMRTQEGSHVEQGPVLNRVVCYLPLFSAFVTMFLSIEISIVVGHSMPTICEQDREHVGRVG